MRVRLAANRRKKKTKNKAPAAFGKGLRSEVPRINDPRLEDPCRANGTPAEHPFVRTQLGLGTVPIREQFLKREITRVRGAEAQALDELWATVEGINDLLFRTYPATFPDYTDRLASRATQMRHLAARAIESATILIGFPADWSSWRRFTCRTLTRTRMSDDEG